MGENNCCKSDKEKDIETLKILLAHWIEHNNSHEEGFREWADKAKNFRKTEVSELISKAADSLKAASDYLLEAKKHM
ncbi:hypothetical protein [Tepidanaerobacter sp. EBM-49]|uniref:hypothetical protein n=1 Tax=Tepidanaerobacter sp. EBM-49 TaxID=1918504 RepID=UPI000AB2B79B|nr:hypothetical protein [Tepidanaerobacter sp. EBM-49]